jgi:hypothetical protein
VAVFNPYHVPTHGELETDGGMALVRASGAAVPSYVLGEGSFLRAGGVDLVTITGGVASAGLAADTLCISNETVNFTAYGPLVTVVMAPSGPILFRRDGNYVRNLVPVDVAAGPLRIALRIVRPNPARHGAVVEFTLGAPTPVRCTVHDVRGSRVATVVEASFGAGSHARRWNGCDDHGRRVAPGVYFVVLATPGGRDTAKLVVAR